MKRNCYLVLFFIALASAGVSHPLHLSFTNLEYKTGADRWELTIKIFSDDFSNALLLSHIEGINPDKEPGTNEGLETLVAWLGNQLSVRFDEREISHRTWKLKGWKNKENACWMTFSFQAALPVKEITVTNNLLLNLYPDQKNLFIFTMGQFQSSFEFKNKRTEALISLQK